MATYAVFGTTENCGSSLIQVLLTSPDTKINACCRNKAKFTRMMPMAAESKRVKIIEGQIDNVDLFASCMRGCKAVFLTISMNDNVPGCRVSQDTTINLLSALRKVKAEADPRTQMPKIVVISSSSLEHKLCRNTPS